MALTFKASLAIAALLAAFAVMLYWPVFSMRPFEEDNVYVLAWADATPAARVLAVDPYYYPEWRPAAYATIWLEQRLGAGQVWPHMVINLGLWIGCALVVCRLTSRFVRLPVAAIAAALLVLTDPRATWTLATIVDRQASMACLFGLIALSMLLGHEGGRGLRTQLAVGALLLVSALSKEYGLAFALAIAGAAILQRRLDWFKPAVAALTIYVALRVLLAGGAVKPYCEEMYFFGAVREVCIDLSEPASLTQMAYNATATLVNLPLLGLLTGSGEPTLAESRLVTGLLLSGLAIVALIRVPRVAWPLAGVVAATALLSVMTYRDRNQLAGACAMAILAGIGLSASLERMTSRMRKTVLLASVAAIIAAQAVLARALVEERRAIAAQIVPCELDIMDRPFVPPYVARLEAAHGLRPCASKAAR